MVQKRHGAREFRPSPERQFLRLSKHHLKTRGARTARMCVDSTIRVSLRHQASVYPYHDSCAKLEEMWISQITWLSRVQIGSILQIDHYSQWYFEASACDDLSFPDLQSVRHGL